MSAKPQIDGFILVDKPKEWTSFDAVRWVRKALKGAKVGHAGTLDPFATGLLVLLVGRATRLMQYMEEHRKTYRGVMRLGSSTDTCDPTGETIFEADPGQVEAVTEEALQGVFDHWTGEVEQVPPRFSAVKIHGEPAYKLARRGEAPELEARGVEIHGLTMESWTPPDLHFEAIVSTGTYVRALARDVGDELGTGAHLLDLRRTSIGPFKIEDAFPLESPEGSGYVSEWVRPMAELLPREMRIEITPAQARRITHGNELRLPADAVRYAAECSHVGAVCREDLIAVGRLIVVGNDGLFQPRTVLSDPRGLGG